jgi:hypothetical protein
VLIGCWHPGRRLGHPELGEDREAQVADWRLLERPLQVLDGGLRRGARTRAACGAAQLVNEPVQHVEHGLQRRAITSVEVIDRDERGPSLVRRRQQREQTV